MEKCDILIVGAGIVGLAVAEYLASAHKDYSIIVIEKHESFGRVTSSRNSEVIHAGIYYPTNSLKARLCLEGRRLLYEYLNRYNLPYRKTGKLIVAVDRTEEGRIEELFDNAKANGVDDVSLLNRKQIASLEPAVRAGAALFSPSTGIFDTHTFMKLLETNAAQAGVLFGYNCMVEAVNKSGLGYEITIKDADGELVQLASSIVINCAGLFAPLIARSAGIDCKKAGYVQHYLKGEYFTVPEIKRDFFKTLIYPPPGTASLGIHTVLDLQGRLKLGPNAFYVDEINYDVDIDHKNDFVHAVKRYLPFMEQYRLTPDMAGIRPKLQAPHDDFKDFVIKEESAKDLPGLINLIGIESPGLTASLAIARYVMKLI
jgi:L-2-hydroxyglutarate oxidase LhgO